MDFVSAKAAMKNNAHSEAGGWHHIAWGFLKVSHIQLGFHQRNV